MRIRKKLRHNVPGDQSFCLNKPHDSRTRYKRRSEITSCWDRASKAAVGLYESLNVKKNSIKLSNVILR